MSLFSGWKKKTLTFAAALIALTILISPLKAQAAGDFYDVPQTDSGYYAIESVYWANIMSDVACSKEVPKGNKCFKPNDNVLRNELAKALVLAAGKTELKPATRTFYDVISTNPYYGYIERAANAASWGGKAPLGACRVSGTTKYFCPATAVNRGDLASSLTIASALTTMTPLPTGPTFSDIPTNSPVFSAVETLACKGIMAGTSATTFSPAGTATRRDLAAYLAKTFMVQLQGYAKQQSAEGIVAPIGGIGILADSNRLYGVTDANGYFSLPFYLLKGNHFLRGQGSGALVPYNVSVASTDFGWKYVNSAKAACQPTLANWVSDIKMAAPAVISGKVLDKDSGDLMTSVPVTAVTKDSFGNLINSAQATSDSSGNFSISGVSPGAVIIAADKANFAAEPLTLDVPIGQTLADKEVNLAPNANFIEGNIQTDTGEALSAVVQVPAAASFYGREMTFATDFTGHYKGSGVKPGVTVALKIIGNDFLDQTRNVASPATTRQTITFGFTFVTSGAGSMVDTRTGGFVTPADQCAKDTNGNIIADAYVVLSNGGTYSGGEYPEQKYYLKTDANGCLTLNNIPAGIYGVAIFKDFPDGTTKYYAFPGDEQQITIDHNQTTSFPLSGLTEITP